MCFFVWHYAGNATIIVGKMSTYPARPTWNHPDVKVLAAKEIAAEVRTWAENSGEVFDDTQDKAFLAVLTLAMQDCPDAYAAGRYLDDLVGWPVDGILISILDRAYNRLRFLSVNLVHSWVMKNAIRFPAVTDDVILVNVGGAEFKATVKGVVHREACCFGEPLSHKGKTIRINAEEVVKVMKTRPTGTRPNPDGGTPVAQRAVG